jgi:hypothetical protein
MLLDDNHILIPIGKTRRASASVVEELIPKAWKEVPVKKKKT